VLVWSVTIAAVYYVEAVEEDVTATSSGDVWGLTSTCVSCSHWRQSSTSVSTWPNNAVLDWPPLSHSLRHRSRSGSRIVVPSSRSNGVPARRPRHTCHSVTSLWRQSNRWLARGIGYNVAAIHKLRRHCIQVKITGILNVVWN